MVRRYLLALPGLVGFLWMLSACAAKPYGDYSNVPDRDSCTLDVALPNMACDEACPIKVRQALRSVDGVQTVDVDYEARRATVEAVYPACSSGGFDQMMSNLYQRGYRAKVVSARSGFAAGFPH